jgi:hypothetical protein
LAGKALRAFFCARAGKNPKRTENNFQLRKRTPRQNRLFIGKTAGYHRKSRKTLWKMPMYKMKIFF